MAHGLLWEYLRGQLDSDRQELVRRELTQSVELQSQQALIREGLEILGRLSNVSVPSQLQTEIARHAGWLDFVLRKIGFEKWPTGVRYGLEALVVSAGVVSISLVIPWQRVMDFRWQSSGPVLLAEVSRGPGFGSPDAKDTSDEAPGEVVVASSNQLSDSATAGTQPEKNESAVNRPSAASLPKPKDSGARVNAAPASSRFATSSKSTSSLQAKPGAVEGVLFRGNLSAGNLDEATGSLVQFISERGGAKAGDVPLGWRRGAGSYFHFTLAEEHLQEFSSKASGLGTFRMQRERHERVMPQGTVRVIVTVEPK